MSIPDQVLAGFFDRLVADDAVSDAVIERLRACLADGNIPAANTMLKIINEESGDTTA